MRDEVAGVSEPGRRREDDENLVVFQPTAVEADATTSETASPPVRGAGDPPALFQASRGEAVGRKPGASGTETSLVFSAQFTPEVAGEEAASTLDKASRPPLLAEGLDTYNQSATGDLSSTMATSHQFAAFVDSDGRGWDEGAECAFDPSPDSRRYQACGDGVVATVAEWIGRRIACVDGGEDPDA